MIECDDPDAEKHIFADDMESLFYVVQYSAFLWQPHAFDQNRLTMVMSRLFDTFTDGRGWTLHGLIPKRQALIERIYIGGANFESEAVGEWLESMLTFRSALEAGPKDCRNEWSDPASIDAFWADFLRTHTLETNNRVVHELDDTEYLNSRLPAPRPVSGSGFEARLFLPSESKRKREGEQERSSSESPQRRVRSRTTMT